MEVQRIGYGKVDKCRFVGVFSTNEYLGKGRGIRLHFPIFYDTILILRKLAAKNSR